MEEKMIKTFEEKKEHAQLMRNIFGITAVLYIGFIVFIVCIHRYEILWWAFNVWLLLVCIAVKNQNEKKDAELVLKYMDRLYYPWIRVDERLPEEDPHNKGNSVGVIILFPSDRVSIGYYSFKNRIWFIPRFLGIVNPIYWMPMPKVKP